MKIRSFNANEYMSWILSSASPHNIVAAVKVCDNLDIDQLNLALRKAGSNQASLRATIRKAEEGFFYFDAPVETELLSNNKTWLEIANEYLSYSFEYDNSLYKFLLLKNANQSYIVFVVHHIISDAATAIEFIKDVLNQYYNAPSSLIVEHDAFPDFINMYPKNSSLSPNLPKEKVKTEAQVITLTKQELCLALKKAKSIGVYFNTLITYILLQIATNIFGSEQYSIITPVNLRKHRDLTNDNRLSFFSSNIAFDFKKSNDIREMLLKIKRQFLNRNPVKNINAIKSSIENEKSAKDFCENFISKSPAFGISSNTVGKVLMPKVIDEFFLFVNTQQYFSYPGSFTLQYTLTDSKLCISINYPTHLTQDGAVSYLAKKLKEALVHPEICII